MRGHVRKRGAKWCFVIDIGIDENGKRKQKWYSGYNTKKDAEQALTETLQKLNSGIYVDSKNLSLAEYLKLWIKEYAELKVAPKTLRSYKDTVENHLIPNLGKTKLEKLTPSIIQQYYGHCMRETNLSGTSILYNHKILKQALNQAVKWQLLVRNPCDAVDAPKKNKKDIYVLDELEIDNLLEHLKNKTIYLPVLLAITTGMRRGEIAGLKWENVDFQNETIYVKNALQRINGKLEIIPTKTQKGKRPIALPKSIISTLKKIRKAQIEKRLSLGDEYNNENYVCCWDDGHPLDPDYITKSFIKTRNKLGLKVRFHDLRHTHATMLLKAGVHPKIVQERLGHSQISVTMDTYSHVTPQMQKQAAEKIDFIINT